MIQLVCAVLFLQVTHLSHGVNFSLGYKPLLSSCVWLFKSGKPRPHQRSKVVLPPSSGSVKQVSAGREHASVLTTDGQGAISQVICKGSYSLFFHHKCSCLLLEANGMRREFQTTVDRSLW